MLFIGAMADPSRVASLSTSSKETAASDLPKVKTAWSSIFSYSVMSGWAT